MRDDGGVAWRSSWRAVHRYLNTQEGEGGIEIPKKVGEGLNI